MREDDALRTFCKQANQALASVSKNLVTCDIETCLIAMFGVIASIGTLGLANLCTGRCMHGLFSQKIDAAIKIDRMRVRLNTIDRTADKADIQRNRDYSSVAVSVSTPIHNIPTTTRY